MNNRFIVVDLETTGNKVGIDKIIQVGAILIENGEIVERFASFVNPDIKLSPFIKQFTGINDTMLKKAPTFAHIAPMLLEMLNGSYFVAHNVPFDFAFLKAEIETSGYQLDDLPTIDTVELSRLLYPTLSGYKLNQLAAEFAIDHDQPHRADSDAEVTAYLFLHLLARLERLPLVTLLKINELEVHLQSDFRSLLYNVIEVKRQSLGNVREDLDFYQGIVLQQRLAPSLLQEVDIKPLELNEIWSLLSAVHPNFEVRNGQIEMINTISEAFHNHYHALIEAGTGTGKTLAYLIPTILFAKEKGQPVVISTYTTQLQEQIMTEELKVLAEALPFSVRSALLKGRNHYLCLRKFAEFLNDDHAENYDNALTKGQLLIWLTETVTGDVDELNLTSGGMIFWNKIKSETDSCMNKRCPWFSRCFYQQSRKNAEVADVVITNHALLLADVKNNFSLLPPYSELVIDEAHHVEDAASEHLGIQLDYFTINSLLNQIGSTSDGSLLERVLELNADAISLPIRTTIDEQYAQLKSGIDELFRTIRTFILSKNGSIKNEIGRISYRYQLLKESGSLWKEVKNSAFATIEELKDFRDALIRITETVITKKNDLTYDQQGIITDFEAVIQKLDHLVSNLCTLLFEVHGNRVTWIETEPKGAQNSSYLYSQPIDPSEILRDQLFAKKQSVILTSATLAIKDSFDYIINRLGLNDFEVRTKIIASPFAYQDQVQLLIPTDVPQIKDVEQDEFIKEIADRIVKISRVTKGRMLILFTAFDMLEKTYFAVKKATELDDFVLIAQGISSGSRAKLTKNFKRFDQAILFGTSSFWEGIDIPGEDLSCIVIVRLPFSPPDSPILAAKAEALKQEGKNAFMELYLPQAILRFKQGFGRLVRARNDRGAVVVLDRRITTKSYGKKFISALPTIAIHEGETAFLIEQLNDWL